MRLNRSFALLNYIVRGLFWTFEILTRALQRMHKARLSKTFNEKMAHSFVSAVLHFHPGL
jgi:hypothetical protein